MYARLWGVQQWVLIAFAHIQIEQVSKMSKMPQNEKSQKLDYILTFTFMTNMYYIIKQFIIMVYSALRLHL